MRIDQLVPAYHRGDAIGDTATHMRDFFRAEGFVSDIYCLTRDSGLEGESILFKDYPDPGPGDVTLFHFALPSPLTPAFKNLKSRRVMIYHNITPESFFSPYSMEMARLTRLGREELRTLAGFTDLGLADSEYNRLELEAMGFPKTAVFPLFIDFEKYERPSGRLAHSLFDDDRTNILFVGRIVPNKRIEDLIKVTFYYKKYISPLVRLIVVGKTGSLPVYYRALVRLADEFYLKPDEVCFTGHVPDEDLFALYRTSDVFLSLSEHEGFGLPFVESLVFDLPVLAYDCTAVPYTLGDAGVLLKHKRPAQVAELAHLISVDQDLRNRILAGQRLRLTDYRRQGLKAFLLENLRTLVTRDD